MMKRFASIVLFVAVCLSLCACGNSNKAEKDYSMKIDYLGNDFSWSMSVSDAESWIKKNQLTGNTITVDKTDATTSVSDGYYRFVFYNDFDGKLGRVIINIKNALPVLRKDYGEPEKIDKDSYCWYGQMDGKETSIVDHENLEIVNFNLKEYWDTKE